MELYRLKHVPTGLYYQPHKHRGSNLSKKGKIYTTQSHGLSSAFRHNSIKFTVYCEENSNIFKLTKDLIIWKKVAWCYGQMLGDTFTSDWVIEKIKVEE